MLCLREKVINQILEDFNLEDTPDNKLIADSSIEKLILQQELYSIQQIYPDLYYRDLHIVEDRPQLLHIPQPPQNVTELCSTWEFHWFRDEVSLLVRSTDDFYTLDNFSIVTRNMLYLTYPPANKAELLSFFRKYLHTEDGHLWFTYGQISALISWTVRLKPKNFDGFLRALHCANITY